MVTGKLSEIPSYWEEGGGGEYLISKDPVRDVDTPRLYYCNRNHKSSTGSIAY